MDASRATKRRRVSEHFEKEDESEPDWGEAIETQESVMRVAEFPIETNVYIINKASNRKLYAQGTKNWQEGFGAGSPPSAVHADGVWRIVREDGGFRILNEYSQRCLYAAAGHNWEKSAAQGFPSPLFTLMASGGLRRIWTVSASLTSIRSVCFMLRKKELEKKGGRRLATQRRSWRWRLVHHPRSGADVR